MTSYVSAIFSPCVSLRVSAVFLLKRRRRVKYVMRPLVPPRTRSATRHSVWCVACLGVTGSHVLVSLSRGASIRAARRRTLCSAAGPRRASDVEERHSSLCLTSGALVARAAAWQTFCLRDLRSGETTR
jgi:hypothetical protein